MFTYPVNIPCRNRSAIACKYVRERPNRNKKKKFVNKPHKMTGRLPILSHIRPQTGDPKIEPQAKKEAISPQ